MRTPNDREIIGDWSNLKGTAYHLVYVIWSLLVKPDQALRFYAGNDLLANPIAPIKPSDVSQTATVHVLGQSAQSDQWIQLKATMTPWTVSELLEENLLSNFICNAFVSIQRRRLWEVSLVTTATIQSKAIGTFVKEPESKPALYAKFISQCQAARQRFVDSGTECPDEEQVHQVGLECLRQMASCEPKSLDLLRAEIRAELAPTYTSRKAQTKVCNELLGHILNVTAAGPNQTTVFDEQWLAHHYPSGLRPLRTLESEPMRVIRECLKLPREWSAHAHFPRHGPDSNFERFLQSQQTVFILLGASGTGKSWCTAHWAVDTLSQCVKVHVNWLDLDQYRSLHELLMSVFRLQTPDAGGDQVLNRLRSIALETNQAPVLFVDDVRVGNELPDLVVHRLAQLVDDCRAYGLKLVLTCQHGPWENYNLGNGIDLADVYQAPESHGRSPKSYSYLLGELSPEEQLGILNLRLPRHQAERFANQLRDPAYVFLRNAYRFAAYLARLEGSQGRTRQSIPIDIDRLLDDRVSTIIKSAAARIGRPVDAARGVFALLVDAMWARQPQRLPYSEAAEIAENLLGRQGKVLVDELERIGLVQIGHGLELAEPQIAEREFSLRLAREISTDPDRIVNLDSRRDGSLVATLIRGVDEGWFDLSTDLLRLGGQWSKPVAQGLAERCGAESDYRVLGLLSALARQETGKLVGAAGCDALGRLAARGDEALKWVVAMYTSDEQTDRHRGEHALAIAYEYAPRNVAAAIRLRLLMSHRFNSLESPRELARWIHGAATPLANITHKFSARVAQQLTARYGRQLSQSEGEITRPDSLEQTRGLIAYYSGSEPLQALITQASSADWKERYHTIEALRAVAFVEPAAVATAMLGLLANEQDWRVLQRQMWAAYPLIRDYGSQVLIAVRDRGLLEWNQPATVANHTLALLAALQERGASSTKPPLPEQLDGYKPEERAILTEILAYVWWRWSDSLPEARGVLSQLCEPIAADMSAEVQVFAYRGAAIATLALISFDAGIKQIDSKTQVYAFGHHSAHLYVDTSKLLDEHASEIIEHQSYPHLQALLISCIESETKVGFLKPARDYAFHSASLCSDILARIAPRLSSPGELLKALAADWAALRIAAGIVESGNADPNSLAAIEELCRLTDGRLGGQVETDREHCLAALCRLNGDAKEAFESYRRDHKSHILDFRGPVRGFAELVSANPAQMLGMLDGLLETDDDFKALFNWSHEAKSWESVVLAQVYRRMFDARPLTKKEAISCCNAVLTAVRAVPATKERFEYELIYSHIKARLEDSQCSTSIKLTLEGQTRITQSHAAALDILTRCGSERPPNLQSELWNDRRAWWETRDFSLKFGGGSIGYKSYTVYTYPAVRLALLAANSARPQTDIASEFMRGRQAANEQLTGIEHRLFIDNVRAPYLLRRLLKKAKRVATQWPRDGRFWELIGDLLLRLGRMDDSIRACNHAVSLGCSPAYASAAYYTIACACARLDLKDDCKQAIVAADQLNRVDRKHMESDPDLESIRSEPWFGQMLSEPSS